MATETIQGIRSKIWQYNFKIATYIRYQKGKYMATEETYGDKDKNMATEETYITERRPWHQKKNTWQLDKDMTTGETHITERPP